MFDGFIGFFLFHSADAIFLPTFQQTDRFSFLSFAVAVDKDEHRLEEGSDHLLSLLCFQLLSTLFFFSAVCPSFPSDTCVSTPFEEGIEV